MKQIVKIMWKTAKYVEIEADSYEDALVEASRHLKEVELEGEIVNDSVCVEPSWAK